MMTSSAPDPDADASDLSIGDLAARTGVSAATLRTWEDRYGVPSPRRLSGGHRRYGSDDVELVRQILRRRAAGQTMTAAVADTSAALDRPESSVYASLRRRHPDLESQRVRKSTLLALSHAMEDECCAQADDPTLFVGFQRLRFYEQSADRWRELARTAQAVVIFAAGFEPPSKTDRYPIHVPIPTDAQLRREWVLVCDSPDYPACLAAWELPGQRPSTPGDRLYEIVWSVDPRVVRDAAHVCAGLAHSFSPDTVDLDALALSGTPPPASPDLRRANGLLNRILSYLESNPSR